MSLIHRTSIRLQCKVIQNGIKSNKIFLNNFIRRKYQSIQIPEKAPSAIDYQLHKLRTSTHSTVNVSSYSLLIFINRYFNKLNLWSIRHPLMLAVGVATIKNSWCDYSAQKLIEKRDSNSFNWSRLVLFTLFGFMYCGYVQYAVYNKLYPLLFTRHRIRGKFIRTSLNTMTDMVFHSTLFYFPIFYIFRGMVYEQSISMKVIHDSLYQYFCVNFKDDMIALYKVWLPAQAIMFAVIPIQYRVPYISMVGILWTIILSLLRGDSQKEETKIIKKQQKSIEIMVKSPISIPTKQKEPQIM